LNLQAGGPFKSGFGLSEALVETRGQQAIQYFSDEQICIDAVAAMRWNPYYLKTAKRWKCRSCGNQFSVKKFTIFEDSPITLQKWLPALWMLVNCKNGISSYEIHPQPRSLAEVRMVHVAGCTTLRFVKGGIPLPLPPTA